MKKYRFFLLFITACLILASCGNHDIESAEPSDVPEDAATTEMTIQTESTSASVNPLTVLSDYDLYETVYFQILDLVDSYPSETAALEGMTQAQRVFYVLSIYDMEVQCGGLCQFFVNSSRSLAPYVEECMETVGAEEHKELFTGFVEENQIDLSDLNSFVIHDIEDYAAQTARYDFDSFDMAYYDLPPIFDQLVEYIRNNLNEF